MGQGSDSIGEDFTEEIEQLFRRQERETSVNYMKRLYTLAQAAPIKSTILCPCCTRKHIKTTYHKVFCNSAKAGQKRGKSSCKDKYWNWTSDERFDRIYSKERGVQSREELSERENDSYSTDND